MKYITFTCAALLTLLLANPAAARVPYAAEDAFYQGLYHAVNKNFTRAKDMFEESLATDPTYYRP